MFQQAVLYPSFVIPYPISKNNGKDIQQAVHNVLCNPKYPLPDNLFYYKDILQAVLNFQHYFAILNTLSKTNCLQGYSTSSS